MLVSPFYITISKVLCFSFFLYYFSQVFISLESLSLSLSLSLIFIQKYIFFICEFSDLSFPSSCSVSESLPPVLPVSGLSLSHSFYLSVHSFTTVQVHHYFVQRNFNETPFLFQIHTVKLQPASTTFCLSLQFLQFIERVMFLSLTGNLDNCAMKPFLFLRREGSKTLTCTHAPPLCVEYGLRSPNSCVDISLVGHFLTPVFQEK